LYAARHLKMEFKCYWKQLAARAAFVCHAPMITGDASLKPGILTDLRLVRELKKALCCVSAAKGKTMRRKKYFKISLQKRNKRS
jgi:hypothetical protein